MELKIIEFLTTCESPMETLKIAKAVEKKTKKDVNPTLYKLEKEGKLTKLSDVGGTNPKWYITEKGVTIEKSEPKYHPDLQDEHQRNILELLKTSEDPIPTINIAKTILGKDATAKDINKILYKLEKEGTVKKISETNGSNPRWIKV